MSLITWNESLVTGIPIIDSQHKNLVEKMNRLFDCIEGNSSCDYLKVTLYSLVDYTYYHFETEERFFYKYEYPDRINHMKEHEKFRKDISKFINIPDKNSRELAVEVLNFLNFWLVHHIKHVDMEYIEFLKDKLRNEV